MQTELSEASTEGVLKRAQRDCRAFCLSLKGLGVEVVMTAIAGVVAALLGASPLVAALSGLVGFLVVVGAAFIASLALAPVRQRDEARAVLPSGNPDEAIANEAQALANEMRSIYRAAQAHAITRGIWDNEDVKRSNQAIADAKARYQNDVAVRALNLYDRLRDEGYPLAGIDGASITEPRGSIGIAQLGDAFSAIARSIKEADSDLLEVLDDRIRVGTDLQLETEAPPAEPEEVFSDPRFGRVVAFHNDTYRLLMRRHPAYAEELSKYIEDYGERDIAKGREPDESLEARARRSPSAITLRATLDGLREIRRDLGR